LESPIICWVPVLSLGTGHLEMGQVCAGLIVTVPWEMTHPRYLTDSLWKAHFVVKGEMLSLRTWEDFFDDIDMRS